MEEKPDSGSKSGGILPVILFVAGIIAILIAVKVII